MRVLVTGGSGFIGSHLIRRLANEGYEVFNIDIRSPNPIDIRDVKRVKRVFEEFRPEAVVHLAAVASVPLCEQNPREAYETNVLGSLNIFKLCSEYGAKCIFSSSAAVYGEPNVIPTPEDAPKDPINHYGLTKLVGEYICRFIMKTNYVIFRIFNCYGPNCNRSYVIPDTIRKLTKNKNPIRMLGTGEESRDFVYIDDVINAILLAINKKDVIGTFNIGTGKNIKIRELAAKIAQIMGKKVRFVFDTKKRKGDFSISCADISKVTKMIGWYPKVSLDEGLKRTILSYQN